MPTAITLQNLLNQKPESYVLIDIRSPGEFATHHAKNAFNVPYEVLMMYPESYLNKTQVYYLICAHGTLSHRASAILRSYGYKVGNIKSGYDMRCFCYC